MKFLFLLLWSSISLVPNDFLLIVSTVDTNSATELCSLFPTKGFLSSNSPLIDVSWTISSECYETGRETGQGNFTSTFFFGCPGTTIYNLSVSATNEDNSNLSTTIYMKFQECSDYYWYAFSKGSEKTGRSLKNGSELLIWPVSTLESGISERSHTSSTPFDESIQIGLSMNDTSAIPQITLLSPDGSLISYAWNEQIFFNKDLSCWTTTIFFKSWNDFNVKIKAADKYQGNQAVRESIEYFCPATVNFSSIFLTKYFDGVLIDEFSEVDIDKNMNENNSSEFLYRHPCVQSTAVIIRGEYILSTTDDFDSVTVYLIKKKIAFIILTTTGISWLDNNSTAYHIPYQSSKVTSSALPAANFLVTAINCNTLTNAERIVNINDIIIAVNKSEKTDRFYFTTDGWSTYSEVLFGEVIDLLDINILSSGFGRVVFLYQKKEGGSKYTRVFNFHNYVNNTFNGEFKEEISLEQSGVDKDILGETCYMASNNIGQVYLVGKAIYISTDSSITYLPLPMISIDPIPDGPIRNIVFSIDCKCALIYNSGEIFICYPNQDYFVQIQAYGGKHSYLRFDNLERIVLLIIHPNKTTFDHQIKYPILLKSEIAVFSQLYKNLLNNECPFFDFSVNYPAEGLAYIDKTTEINTDTTVVARGSVVNLIIRSTKEILVNSTITSISSVELNTTEMTYNIMKTVRTDTKLTAVQEGISYLFITPNGATYQCSDVLRVLNVYVGCPKGRHVRLKDGNNIRLFYSKTRFKPELELFDGETKVKDVDMNFAVFMLDRPKGTKIKYCQTAESVGCIRKPQTWKDFENSQEIWNHSTYRSCFEGPPEDFDKTQYYNLMNQSDHSCIILMPKNREYKFKAIVLDPEFSYCYLSTEFTVTVFGEPMSIGYSMAIIAGVLILCAVGVFITHASLNASYAKKNKKKN